MAKRIEKLTLNGFRGATCPVEIDLDTSKPAVMVFGENGTGKSTIVDAIDFICNGQYGSLNERSSTRPKTHLPSIGSTAEALVVSLTFGGQTWSAGLGKGGPESTGPGGRPTARILRRSQILQVINAQPKDRYGALQTFIVVPGVQKCENSLRQANRTVDQELNDAIVAKQQAEDTLEKLWKAEGSSGKGYLEWAKDKIKEKPHDLEAVVSGADQILTALRDAIGTRNQLDTDKLEESERETELQEAQKALKDAETDGTEQDSALIAVLQDAKTFLEGYESASEKVFFNSIFPL